VNGEEGLRREIGLVAAALIVVNGTIGTGIFKVPAETARLTGSVPLSLALWLAGGVMALCGALAIAELAAAIPRSGGVYEYLRRGWGPTPAFLYGWTRLVLLIPASAGSFARLSAESLGQLAGWAPDAQRDGHVALAFIVPAAALNLIGVKESAGTQALVSALKYVGVAALAVIGLAAAAPPEVMLERAPDVTTATIFAALVSVMWAYDGWADLSHVAGEVRDPARTLPRALLLGVAMIIVVYGLANLGYARGLGLDGLRAADVPAADLAGHVLGRGGRVFLSALILVSCTGCAMNTLLTGPRVLVPMAADGLFPRWIGAVSPRTGVPARAIAISSLLAAIFVEWRTFEQLAGAFVVGVFPFYALAVAAVYVLRRREPDLPRPFRVPLYPLTPAIFLVGAAALLYGALAGVNTIALFAFAIVLAGLPIRYAWLKTAARA
jgi:basic amino acid/polyamine antiporter, APA family